MHGTIGNIDGCCSTVDFGGHDGRGNFYARYLIVSDPDKATELNPVLGYLQPGGEFRALYGSKHYMDDMGIFYEYSNLDSLPKKSLPAIEMRCVSNKKYFGIRQNTLESKFNFPFPVIATTFRGSLCVLQNDATGIVSAKKASTKHDISNLQKFDFFTKNGRMSSGILWRRMLMRPQSADV